MSFLFKSNKKPPTSALPQATRNIRSSDGPPSSIPSINGVGAEAQEGRAKSPPPFQNVNGSINSVQNEKAPSRSLDESLSSFEKVVKSPSPEQKTNGRERSDSEIQGIQQQARIPMAPSRAPPDPSPYPWSQRQLTYTVPHIYPFPRYGAAVNSLSSKDGSIYIMGGLINGSTVKGDLWMMEAASATPTCYPVTTTSEGPGPRVGHASLLVGNAFIVFGGDTKTEESDMLDDTLYLLNTSTRQWSRAAPAGVRPPGRYGHTLNILGSKIYIFGGQVEGYFFNDLVAFDLNALQQATNRWEILIQNTIDGGPPHGQIPPARTNHSMITWNDKMYLFGGTDGVTWFNDVWSYDPRTNSWTQLECIGYIPAAREGHASALVGDVMYIFGGRTEEGNDLGDLAAFRISSRRWYTFQNMGPSPSPRSGHSMTAVGKTIAVLGGEPSSAPRDPGELSLAYFLDTSKIRYPADSHSQIPADQRIQGIRRPTGERNGVPMASNDVQASTAPLAAQGPQQIRPMQSREVVDPRANGSRQGTPEVTSPIMRGPDVRGNDPAAGSRLPRAAAGAMNGSMSPQPSARQPTRPERSFSPSNELNRDGAAAENRGFTSPPPNEGQQKARVPKMAPSLNDHDYLQDQVAASYNKPQTYQPQPIVDVNENSAGAPVRNGSKAQRPQVSTERSEATPRPSTDRPSMDTARPSMDRPSMDRQVAPSRFLDSRQSQDREAPVDSGLGSSPALSQLTDNLTKELEAERSRNAWYASELALARKAGYSQSASGPNGTVLDEHAVDSVGADDKPLVEALLKMRAELLRVQSSIDNQSKRTAEQIAEIEKQRDSAINEAVFAKAKLASQGRSSAFGDRDLAGTPDADRASELNRRLATALAGHADLSKQLQGLRQDKEAERQARQLAEESTEAAQKRVAELDSDRQRNASELESMRAELYETQRSAREHASNHAEAASSRDLLSVDHKELTGKHESALAEIGTHASVLASLREALGASTGKSDMLERRLDEERASRDDLQSKLSQLKAEHEDRTAELERTSGRLRDAEELADKHANEARTHRQALTDGLGKATQPRDVSQGAVDERIAIHQRQVETATAMARQNQTAADLASEKLRRAEERIAGLEAYQEQASREGLSVRKQLQAALRDSRSMTEERSRLQQQVQSQMLETNAIAVQHSALKDVLAERGINPTDFRKSRVLDSPSSQRYGATTPDLQRVRELEQQLEVSHRSHEEVKGHLDEVQEREIGMRREYEEKLTALDNDHQAAAKYLRGTEKMLSKMKQELQRVKNEAAQYVEELEGLRAKEATRGTSSDMDLERENMRRDMETAKAGLVESMAPLESKITNLQSDLQSRELDLETLRSSHTTTQADLATMRSTHEASRSDIERLQQENTALEARAKDAENKVQLLLDQVESSVDNYRRQSNLPNGSSHQRGPSTATIDTLAQDDNIPRGHERNQSIGGDSVYSQSINPSDSHMELSAVTHGSAEDMQNGRNSMALDSLANELDALRSHWEVTNKNNYRLSDKFDFERTPTAGTFPSSATGGHAGVDHMGGGGSGGAGTSEYGSGSLAHWRQGLVDDGEDEEGTPAGGRSRSNSPFKGMTRQEAAQT